MFLLEPWHCCSCVMWSHIDLAETFVTLHHTAAAMSRFLPQNFKQMVTTHSKGNKDQSRKQQNLKGTYRGAKTHEGNRVVSLIHSWAPPYREELKYCAVGSLLTRSAGHARWPHCARKCRSTGNKRSYEGYHAYRIPCVNHWQEEHLKVKPVPSDYHKSLVLYRYGKNSNVINVIRINVL